MAKAKAEKTEETIEAELIRLTKEKPQKDDEARKKYLARLVRAGNGLPEAEWKKLTEEAQAWVNEGVEAVNEKQPIIDFQADSTDDSVDAAPAKDKKAPAKSADASADDSADDSVDDSVDESKKPKAKAEAKGKASKKADASADSADASADDSVDDDSTDASADDSTDDSADDSVDDSADDSVDDSVDDPKPAKGKKAPAKSADASADDSVDDSVDETPPAKGKPKAEAASSGRKKIAEDPPAKTKEKAKAEPPIGTTEAAAKVSALIRIRELICKKPDYTREKVEKVLTKEGITALSGTQIAVAYYDSRQMMAMAAINGMLTKEATAKFAPVDDDD